MAVLWLIFSVVALSLNLWRLALAHRGVRWAQQQDDLELRAVARDDRRNRLVLSLVCAFFVTYAARRVSVPIHDPFIRQLMWTMGTAIMAVLAYDAGRALREKHRMYAMWLPLLGFFSFRRVGTAAAFAGAVAVVAPVAIEVSAPEAEAEPRKQTAQRVSSDPDGQEKDVGGRFGGSLRAREPAANAGRSPAPLNDEAPAPEGEGSVDEAGGSAVERVLDVDPVGSLDLDEDALPGLGLELDVDLGDELEAVGGVLTGEDGDGPAIP